jgi:membrane protein DedA with SNARE-associated domain
MSFTILAIRLIDHLGLLGLALGVFLNGLSVPGLSEVLLPLAGVAVKQGRFSILLLLPVVMLAQLLGVTLAYIIGRRGGLPLISKYGKYIFISHHDLTTGQNAFEKHGEALVIVGSFIPGIQGLVGYVAGIAEMNYGRFLAAVLAGKLVWIGGLLAFGYVLGGHLSLLDSIIRRLGVVILAAAIVVGIWYVRRHQRHKGAKIEG